MCGACRNEVGALLSAVSLLAMAGAAVMFSGAAAGTAIIAALVVFSLARGLCSVSAKDVLCKTISKSRRGTLMGWSAGLSGIAILAVGLSLGAVDEAEDGLAVFVALLALGAVLWVLAAVAFAGIRESAGATGGGGNALSVASQQLRLLIDDRRFRQFVVARALLLSAALLPPFYVLIAQQTSDAGLLGLGVLIVANGLASSLSSPIWGYLGDRSSRAVMAIAAAGVGAVGLLTFAAVDLAWSWATGEIGLALGFMLLSIMHGGIRLGRKVYLVDMADSDTRAAYVAVSNTVIGVLMLVGGLIGLFADWFGVSFVVLLLALLSLVAAAFVLRLPDVSLPA